jgi:hypothetical protein
MGSGVSMSDQKPVAWLRQRDNRLALSDGGVFGDDWTPLYYAALAQPEQEPYPLPESLYPDSKDWVASDYAGRVEWLYFMYESKKREVEQLETAQPQRKPRTADEIDGLAINYDGLPNSFLELARAIEKAHGIS